MVVTKKARKMTSSLLKSRCSKTFYDLYRNRGSAYKVNFFRGIFFGLGTFLGGTVIVALVIFLLIDLIIASQS